MSNKLNLFKFVHKHREPSTASDGASAPLDTLNSPYDPHEVNQIEIDNSGSEQPYSPDTGSFHDLRGPMRSASEASLIFERSVEDPNPVFHDEKGLKCNHQSFANLPSHFSMENFVPPCLDATTKILTDDTADLDNVDMVYSRRPSSVKNLSMAFNTGRAKSFADEASIPQSPQQRTRSFASVKDLNSQPSRPPILSFYSYADMINSEQPRRPSISQSLSSSFVNSRSNSISSNSNKFQQGNSVTPKRNSTSNNTNNHNLFKPVSPYTAINSQRLPRSARKFSLGPENNSPNSSDDESEYPPTPRMNSISRVSSRKQNSSQFQDRRYSGPQSLLTRTNSNQSSLISGASSRHYRAPVCFDEQDEDEDEMVVSSIGERLRSNTGEIISN